MASRPEIEAYYDTAGTLHALRMEPIQGAYPDYTCAFFDGDYSKSYPQAQSDKYTWILDNLGLGQDLSGKRILDIGCGWGPMLNAIRERGGQGVGLTLSEGQARHCKTRGLNVHLLNYKDILPNQFGAFHGIVSIGALEHFCSVPEMLDGLQNPIYRNFFAKCAENLVPKGRLFVQTMTWGKRVPDYRMLSLSAPPDSAEAILARMEYMYPGSWLPNGLTQLIECADTHFDFIESNNGRLDYLETLQHWGKATQNLWKPHILRRTLARALPLMLLVLSSRAARIQWSSIFRKDQTTCFLRELMSHERMFLIKK